MKRTTGVMWLLLICSCLANADSFSLRAFTNPGDGTSCTAAILGSSVGCSSSGQGNLATSFASALATGSFETGLGVYTNAVVNSLAGGQFLTSSSQASSNLSDAFIVQGINAGFLRIPVTTQGTAQVITTGSNTNNMGSTAGLGYFMGTGFNNISGRFLLPDGTNTYVFLVPFTAGSFVQLNLTLDAASVCNAQQVYCSATTDYSHTLTIGQVSILDSNLDIAGGASYTTTSGYGYTGMNETPEPSALILFGSGLLSVLSAKRNFR